jgi:hypothetical protein
MAEQVGRLFHVLLEGSSKEAEGYHCRPVAPFPNDASVPPLQMTTMAIGGEGFFGHGSTFNLRPHAADAVFKPCRRWWWRGSDNDNSDAGARGGSVGGQHGKDSVMSNKVSYKSILVN